MLEKIKSSTMVILLITLLIISIISPLSGVQGHIKENDEIEGKNEDKLTYTVHSPTRINNNLDFSTYADSGSGTSGDPYVFDNWEIDGGDKEYCLIVANVTDHFIIRNSHFYNCSATSEGTVGFPDAYKGAVVIRNSTHSAIYNNTISTDFGTGLKVRGNINYSRVEGNKIINVLGNAFDSYDVHTLIFSNNICNNTGAVAFQSIENHTITDNYVNNCSNIGYEFFNMDSSLYNSEIRNNDVSNAGTYGYSVNTQKLTLKNAVVDNCFYGVVLWANTNIIDNFIIKNSNNDGIDIQGNYNTIVRSNITNNGGNNVDSGIRIEGNRNIIKYNDIYNNFLGIYIDQYYNNNTIFNNNIINNTEYDSNYQAYTMGLDNRFNETYPTGGNYWSDYNGVDNYSGENQDIPGSDGIGDTNYTNIYNPWGGGGQPEPDNNNDTYPLMEKFTLPLIRINNNTDLTNASSSGSGTEIDPYIIEDLYVNGSDYGYCIYIGNTTKHFILRNCTLYNASGKSTPYFLDNNLQLRNVTNGSVTNNILRDANRSGLSLSGANNIIVENNVIQNNLHSGIWSYKSDNNTLNDNNISYNTDNGIYMYRTNDSSIFNNSIYNSSFNIDINRESLRNNIFNNNIKKAGDYGIKIWQDSNNNSIYHNSFINNGIDHAYDESNNYWNSTYPYGGNYWDNYTGVDNYAGVNQDITGSDGLGDTNLTILGDSNADEYPLMEPYSLDTQNPSVTNTTPPQKTYMIVIDQDVYVSFDEPMNLSNTPDIKQTNGTDNGGWAFSGWVTNDTAKWTHNNWEPAENITLKVSNYTDMQDNEGSPYEWWFGTIDTTAPEITDNTQSASTTGESLIFNATVTDNMEVHSVYVEWIIADVGYYNYTLTNTHGNFYTKEIITPDEIGNLYYNISARDGTGNWNATQDIVIVSDNDPPSITDNTPASATAGTTITFNATVVENVQLKGANPRVFYWTDITSSTNTTLSHTTQDFYERDYSIPTDATTLYYFINATDTSDLKTSTGLTTISLTDDSPPEITDNTAGVPETGAIYTLNATITDANLDQTRVIYYTDTTSSTNTTLTNTHGDYYTIDISIPTNSTLLWYNFVASDTQGNWAEYGLQMKAINDVSNPTVLSVIPTGTGISESADVYIVFDDSMDTSVTPTLTQTVGTTVSYTFMGWSKTNVNDDTAMWVHNNWESEDSVSLKVSAYDDDAGNTGADYSWSFTIRDHQKPTVSITSPSDGSTGNLLDADITISFSEDMNTSIEPTLTQSTGTIVSYNFEGWTSSTTAKWNHTSKWDWGDIVTLEVSGFYDDSPSQNIGDPYEWSFTVQKDTFKPHVNNTIPATGSSNVDADGDIYIFFNETMDETHTPNLIVNQGTDPGGWSITYMSNETYGNNITYGTIKYSHNTLSFSTTYQLTISNYKDEAGNVGNDYTWGFTTETEDIPPEIVSTSPTNGETDVANNSNVVITFDETMDTTHTHTPTLTVESGTDPTLTPTWTTSKKLTYTPSNAWESYEDIELKIVDYKDQYGNTGADYTWSFKIIDYIKPTVTSVQPPDGAINVSWDRTVLINYSEPMDTTSTPSILQLTGTTVSYSTSWFDSDTLMVTHQNWQHDETIKLRVSAHPDAHGTYGDQHSWTFTIEADTQPPLVSFTTPSDGEENASLTSNVVIVFNEEMNGSYIPTLNDGNNTNYTFIEWRTSTYNNDTAVFSHPEYNGSQNYTLTIDHFKDTSDNLGNPYSWTFTTEMTAEQRMVYRIHLATALLIGLFGVIIGVALIVMIKRLMEDTMDADSFD